MTTRKKHSGKKVIVFGSAALLGVLLVTLFLIAHRRSGLRTESQERIRSAEAGTRVEVAEVRESPPVRTVSLLGETRAFYSVTLYARVSGYLDRLLVDIGDRVKQGQLLAHVESPEQEQAFNSARADAMNKRRIADRSAILRKRKLISQQQADQAFADADVSQANLDTQKVLRDYQNITAPFDGVISNRYVDLGWLLQNASGSQAASQPLYSLTKNDLLRVFMYVDQKDAAYVRTGDSVEISVAGESPVHVETKISMVAGELDPKTRTLLAEVIIPNADQRIIAGTFVQVALHLTMPKLMTLPAQALLLRNERPFVSVIEKGERKNGQEQGTIHYAPIDLAANDGENILIRSGVQPGEQVALSVGNKLSEGQRVRAAVPMPTQEAGQVGAEGKGPLRKAAPGPSPQPESAPHGDAS